MYVCMMSVSSAKGGRAHRLPTERKNMTKMKLVEEDVVVPLRTSACVSAVTITVMVPFGFAWWWQRVEQNLPHRPRIIPMSLMLQG